MKYIAQDDSKCSKTANIPECANCYRNRPVHPNSVVQTWSLPNVYEENSIIVCKSYVKD